MVCPAIISKKVAKYNRQVFVISYHFISLLLHEFCYRIHKLVLRPRSLNISEAKKGRPWDQVDFKQKFNFRTILNCAYFYSRKHYLAFAEPCFRKTICRTASVTNLLLFQNSRPAKNKYMFYGWLKWYLVDGWRFLLHFNSCSMSPKIWLCES